ncbi:MAG: 2-C-methyl-D-erythritol 4-phosphate cytidylyltransferase [Actinomycetota bacterium]
MRSPVLKVVVAVTLPIAFEKLHKDSILITSVGLARAFCLETSVKSQLAIAINEEDSHRVAQFSCEVLTCDPNSPKSLAAALGESDSFDLVAIHDSQRPLTRTIQFHRTLEALIGQVDAVRPVSRFTETLKLVTPEQTVKQTIDRNSILRVSTPEIIRYEAIDFKSDRSNWFVPLKAGTKCAKVDADLESLRINSLADISLLESLIFWQQSMGR